MIDVQQSWEALAGAFRDREERTGDTGAFDAILGLPDGSIVADRPTRKVYYHTAQGDYGAAILSEGAGIPFLEVSRWAGVGVRCVFPPGEDSRKGTPHITGLTTGGRISTNGVTPAEQMLRNALFPKLEQVITLRAFPTNPQSTSVDVRGEYLFTKQDGTLHHFAGGVYDFSTAITALISDQHQLALLCYDVVAGVLTTLTSTAATSTSALPNRGAFNKDDFTALNTKGYIPIAGVYLYYGQIEIVEADFYRDLPVRPFLRYLVLDKYNATAAPTTGDDSADGYSVGSLWVDTTNDKAYVCVDATAGAAVWQLLSGAGTVTSVGLSAPSDLTVTGSPVTTSGTIALSWASQLGNRVLASPSGSTGTPSFRSLVEADLGWTAKTANYFFAAPDGSAGSPSFRAVTAADLTAALANPPAIGTGTPSTGRFTTVTATSAGSSFAGLSNLGAFTNTMASSGNAPVFEGLTDGTFNLNMIFDTWGTGNTGSRFIGRHAGGTKASPSQTKSGHELLYFDGRGHNGTAYVTNARAAVEMYATEDWSSTANGTGMRLRITTDGTTTLTTMLQFDSSGGTRRMGLHGNTPVARPTFGAPTGTATRTTFDTGTVTLSQLAERVKAMIDDFRSRGDFA